MANAGRVAIVPKGDWDSSEAYKRLDAVTYNNILYIAKKVVPKNTAVTNTDYWMPSVAGGVAVKATTKNIGQVQPDGETIEVDADGKISAKTALDTKPTIIATAEPNIADTVEAPMLVTNATKNLLKPTLETTDDNGITYLKNENGTYSLSGKMTDASIASYVTITTSALILSKGRYKFTGGISEGKYIRLILRKPNSNKDENMFDYGDGVVFEANDGDKLLVLLIVNENPSANDIFKPMLTTDLSATYDDFVPYDGYEIKSCGKNLLKPVSLGNNIKVTDGDKISSINTIIDDRTWEYNKANFDIELSPGSYTMVINTIEASDDKNIGMQLLGEKVGIVSIIDLPLYINSVGIKTYRLSIPDDYSNIKKRIMLKIYSGVVQIAIYKNNSSATSYEPYTESTVHITPSTEFPLLGLKSFDGETNIISPGNVEVAYAKNDSGKAILGMVKPTVKNLVSTVEGNPLDATMGAQLKKELDELKAKVDAMSTSTTTE